MARGFPPCVTVPTALIPAPTTTSPSTFKLSTEVTAVSIVVVVPLTVRSPVTVRAPPTCASLLTFRVEIVPVISPNAVEPVSYTHLTLPTNREV